MKNNSFLKKENLYIVFLFLFSILINHYYGNKGVFPVDSFAHFDTGFRILLGEHPFKDYWVVSGPLLDYVQALFFYLFGINWQVYVLQASLFNGVISVSTFVVLRNFKLNTLHSFIYSVFFAILAYPVSGTPFVDHHSAFFSLMGIYSLILGIKSEKRIYWILLPVFFGFAFLSKQVPSSYIMIIVVIVLLFFSFTKKKYYWIKYSFLSSFIFILILIAFGLIQKISLTTFLNQYLLYPQTIGGERINNFNFSYNGMVSHFKFIYISAIPLLFINIKKLFFQKNYFKNNNFYYFLILILFSFSLIFHQVLTRNQTFIFFLIPILFAFSHIKINSYKPSLNKFVHATLILICLFSAIKYHIRFNENRKFHELNYVNFELFSDAKKIDSKFKGLKWITPEYKNKSIEEINLINQVKLHLLNDKRTKMLMTNYSFFSVILKEKFYSPSRWYISDGTDVPLKGNKYFINYKNLIVNLIKNNDISIIYTIYPVESSSVYTYLNESCFTEVKISKILTSYEIKNCSDIDG